MKRLLGVLVALSLPLACIGWEDERAAYCADGGPGCLPHEYPDAGGDDDDGGTDAGSDAGSDAGTDGGVDSGVPFVWDGGKAMVPVSPLTLFATVDTEFEPRLSVDLYEEDGGRPPDVVVQFTVDAGDQFYSNIYATFVADNQVLVDSDDTDSSGRATAAALTASTSTGSYEVIASAPGFDPVVFVLTNTPGLPSSLNVYGGHSQQTQPNTAFDNPITGAVRDNFGNIVNDAVLRYRVPEGGLSFEEVGGPFEVLRGIDAGTGTSSSGLIFAGPTLGEYTATVEVQDAGSLSQELMLYVAAGPVETFTFIDAPATWSAPVGGYFPPIKLRATDSAGYPVQGFGNVTAEWDSEQTTATCWFDEWGGPSFQLETDAGGYGEVQCQAVHAVGEYLVTVQLDSKTEELTFENTEPPVAMAIQDGNGQTAAPGAAYANPLRVVATDNFTNKVVNARVRFSAPSGGATVRFANGTNQLEVFTNGSGIASSGTIQASATSGTVTVQAELIDFGTVAGVSFNLVIE